MSTTHTCTSEAQARTAFAAVRGGDKVVLSAVVSGLSDNAYDVSGPDGAGCEITVYGGLTNFNIRGPGPVDLNVFGNSVVRVYDGDQHTVHIADNKVTVEVFGEGTRVAVRPGTGARGVLLERDGGIGSISSEVPDHRFSKI